jgi:hypothetical protein
MNKNKNKKQPLMLKNKLMALSILIAEVAMFTPVI